MIFSPEISTETIIAIAASILSAIWLLTAYRRYFTRILRHKSRPATDLPKVSIVVYSNDNPEQLSNLLPNIFNQDYPAESEIIIVNDGSSEEIKDIFKFLSQSHRNIYLTFIPDQAHNLSRRKLAITLGVKAAKNNIVVFTNANAVIKSNQWLKAIVSEFNEQTELVIGHAVISPENNKGFGAMIRRFDCAADCAAALAQSLSGRSLRGNNFNIAFKRDTFFNNKGFSRSLNLHGGDDDIFISEISRRGNTAVVCTPESIVEIDILNPAKNYSREKTSHFFTRRFVKGTLPSKLMMGSGSCFAWIWLVSTIVAVVLSLPNLFAIGCELVIAILLWSILGYKWQQTGRKLRLWINGWLVMPLMLVRPFYNLYFKIKSHFGRQRNYTWM